MPGRGRELLVPAWAKPESNGRNGKRKSRFSSSKPLSSHPMKKTAELPRAPPGFPPPIPGMGIPQGLPQNVYLPKTQWKQYTRDSKVYYYNEATKQSVWEPPKEFSEFKRVLEALLKNTSISFVHADALKLQAEHIINYDQGAQQHTQNAVQVQNSIKTVDLTKMTSSPFNLPKFSDRPVNAVLKFNLPRKRVEVGHDFKPVTNILSSNNRIDGFEGIVLPLQKRKKTNDMVDDNDILSIEHSEVYKSLSESKKEFFSLLNDFNISAKGDEKENIDVQWQYALEASITNDPRFLAITGVEEKRAVLKQYLEWKVTIEKKLYQLGQTTAETELKSLLKELTTSKAINSRTRTAVCVDLLETKHSKCFLAVDGETVRYKLVKKYLNDLYDEEKRLLRKQRAEKEKVALEYLLLLAPNSESFNRAEALVKRESLSVTDIADIDTYRVLTSEVDINKDIYNVETWEALVKNIVTGEAKVEEHQKLEEDTKEALIYIQKEKLFPKVWRQVLRRIEANTKILMRKLQDKKSSLIFQGQRELFNFFQNSFSDGSLDLNAPFASVEHLKNWQKILRGEDDSATAVKGETVKIEPTEKIDGEKPLLAGLQDNLILKGLLMLDRKAVIKEYERVIKVFDDKIALVKAALKAFTKAEPKLQMSSKVELEKALDHWCKESKEVALKCLANLKNKLTIDFTGSSDILKNLKEHFGDVCFNQAIVELAEDIGIKIKKYRKMFKNLLSDVIYKSSHVDITYEKFERDMKNESEFKALEAFNSPETNHCREVFEEYMIKFKERKSKKRKIEVKEESNKKPRAKSRSNSSDKEDGEIPDE